MSPGGGQKEQRRKPGGRRMTSGGAQEEPGRRPGNLCAQQTSALHLYMVRYQAPTMRHRHCHVGGRRAGCGLEASWGQLVAKRAGWMQA